MPTTIRDYCESAMTSLERLFNKSPMAFPAEANDARIDLRNALKLLDAPQPPRDERRERIALAAMQGYLANSGAWSDWTNDRIIIESVMRADALIHEFDKTDAK